jgi:proton glutamate symport protein
LPQYSSAAETASGVHFGVGQQILMMLTLMLTSKGVAAVPRASLVVLIAALQSFQLPLEGAAMILGVDAFMDMARTSVNVLGNCLASVVIARWEGEFDAKRGEAEFGSGT